MGSLPRAVFIAWEWNRVASPHLSAYAPPGPGAWQIDTTHVPRPETLFIREAQGEHFMRGFRSTTSRYGWLLDYPEPGYANELTYYRFHPASPEEMPARFAAAERVFETRLWREDLRDWKGRAKPEATRGHLALQAVDLASLSDGELLAHVERCRDWIGEMVFQHHEFNGAALTPLGDFLVQASEWTGLATERLLELMRGSAPYSAGGSPELDSLVEAIRADGEAEAALAEGDPAAVLDGLRSRPGVVGSATRAYVDAVGHRIVDGFDVDNPTGLEMPEVLIAPLRAAVRGERFGASEEEIVEATARVRDQVPDARRPAFDDLLAEARSTYGLRDERGLFSDIWATGIARLALLEAGRLERSEEILEARHAEIRDLVEGRGGPAAGELAERAAHRARTHAVDAPPFLGDPPEPPPSADGLPPGAARMARAVDCVLGSLFGESQAPNEETRVFGLVGRPGVYEGTARVVFGHESFGRIERGDVLVTHSTSEAFNALLPLLGAIVSDSGGALSHAAIVAREFGIPAVVGTREATKRITDGGRVRVDAENGVVEILA